MMQAMNQAAGILHRKMMRIVLSCQMPKSPTTSAMTSLPGGAGGGGGEAILLSRSFSISLGRMWGAVGSPPRAGDGLAIAPVAFL